MTSNPTDDGPAIVATDVRKRYGDVVALDGVSLTIRRGEFFGVLGPNGAGKTTLIEIMEGLRKADSGTVKVLDVPPWPRNTALLPKLGVQTQAAAFFPGLTAKEHLETLAALYGVSREKALGTLAKVGLVEKADSQVTKLSGGQRQRLAIAGALLHEPELVFLDEPTAQLDTQARRNLWEVLRDIRDQGRTVVYTTHHMDEAEALCDRVAIVDRGQVLAVDRPRDLIRALDAPIRVVVPADLISMTDAKELDGVTDVVTEGTSLVLSTREPEKVVPAVSAIVGHGEVQTRTATLEEVYLSLTGKEYQS